MISDGDQSDRRGCGPIRGTRPSSNRRLDPAGCATLSTELEAFLAAGEPPIQREGLSVRCFGPQSRLVDLFSGELRVAVELDGPQHLADAVAYWRNRRKDRLRQEQASPVSRGGRYGGEATDRGRFGGMVQW